MPSVEHPRRAAGCGRRHGRAPQGHDGRSRRRTSSICTTPGGTGDHRRSITTGRATPAVAREVRGAVPEASQLFTIEEKFGGWKEAQARFFAEGAIFDQHLPGQMSVPRVALLRTKRSVPAGLRAHAGVHRRSIWPADRLIPLAGLLREVGVADGLRSSSRPCARRARSRPIGSRSAPRSWRRASTRSSALLVAWVLVRYRLPGPRRRRRAGRSSVRAADGRGGHHADERCYAKNGWLGRYLEPLGIKVAYTPLGVTVALVFIGSAVRRAHGAAGAAGPRAGAGGGGREPRRESLRDLPPRALPDAVCRRRHRLRARLRARDRRVRLGRLHLGQHADARRRSRRC